MFAPGVTPSAASRSARPGSSRMTRTHHARRSDAQRRQPARRLKTDTEDPEDIVKSRTRAEGHDGHEPQNGEARLDPLLACTIIRKLATHGTNSVITVSATTACVWLEHAACDIWNRPAAP